MTKKLLYIALLTLSLTVHAQPEPTPTLIIVITLDQFRYDYLPRFKDHFGKGGFMYLLEKGANFSNATYKHAMNTTGPGHAVILSGAYGNQNGIFANHWYDVEGKRTVYCVADTTVSVVGAPGAGVSPANFDGSTFGDELKLHYNFHSKVISISIKDRAAILLGGKLADISMWMIDSAFVTSSYYAAALPAWVKSFNSSGIINSYFGKVWLKTLPEAAYSTVEPDDSQYESDENGLGRVFPHRITGNDPTRITRSFYYALQTSPFGSEILAAFTKRAILAEQLGKRKTPDLLCVSFSSNDYVGHSYGPFSQEVMDMTVRTDQMLADLLTFVDRKIGLNNCVIVLTGDHGVAPTPEYLRMHVHGTVARRVQHDFLRTHSEEALVRTFGAPGAQRSWVAGIWSRNVYLNRDIIREKNLSVDLVAAALSDSLLKLPDIATAFSRHDVLTLVPRSTTELRIKQSFHRLRSGDVVYALKPYFYEDGDSSGAEHGSPYEYDAHVPLLIAGKGVRSGTYATEASPADIAPTLSALLGVEYPAGRQGRVLVEALKLK